MNFTLTPLERMTRVWEKRNTLFIIIAKGYSTSDLFLEILFNITKFYILIPLHYTMKRILSLLFIMLFIISASVAMMGLVENQQPQTNAISDAAAILFGISPSESLNWAGYAVTGSDITNVSGSFVVPSPSSAGPNAGAVSNLVISAVPQTGISAYSNSEAKDHSGGSSTTSYAAFWAGIDGYNSNTVEQAGVLMEVQNGVASYRVWYEFYPAAPVYANWAPNPGDNIAVYVNYTSSNNTFVATVVDTTLGEVYHSPYTSVSGADRSSAEWITEAPSSGQRILPLADFGTADFGPYYVNNKAGNGATVNGQTGGIGTLSSYYTVYQINMVQRNGSLMAQTSSLQGTDSFYVTWESS